MKCLSLCLFVVSFGLGAHAEMKSYCVKSLQKRTADFQQVKEKVSSGSITQEAFEETHIPELLLAADQSSNDCAQEYDENDQEKIKAEFMTQYHEQTDLLKAAARSPAQAKR